MKGFWNGSKVTSRKRYLSCSVFLKLGFWHPTVNEHYLASHISGKGSKLQCSCKVPVLEGRGGCVTLLFKTKTPSLPNAVRKAFVTALTPETSLLQPLSEIKLIITWKRCTRYDNHRIFHAGKIAAYTQTGSHQVEMKRFPLPGENSIRCMWWKRKLTNISHVMKTHELVHQS